MATLYYMLVNWTKTYCIVLAFLFVISSLAIADEASDAELKSIQKLIERTEKLTENKSVRDQLKRSRRHLDRVRDLWGMGAIPNSLVLLLEVRAILYKQGSNQSQSLQNNLRYAMKRLWPFLIKTERFRSEIQTISGIRYVRMIVPEGVYTMSFPEDAKSGEVVSGRIQAFPLQSASLYLLTVMGSPVVADGSLRKWSVPDSLEMTLSDPWGNTILRATHRFVSAQQAAPAITDPRLQVEKEPREAKQNIEIPHLRFQISSRVKAGGYMIVKGPFDGDFNNTTVGIGKYKGYIVSESPGKLIVQIHPQMTGDWTVLVSESDYWARCRVRVQKEEVDPLTTLSACTPPGKS